VPPGEFRASSRSISTAARIGRHTLTCMHFSARGSKTEWRSTSLRCGSSESRSAGRGRFSTAWSAMSAGSFELVRPSLIRRLLARAIARSGLPCPYFRRARGHAGTVSSSCSRRREGRCGSRTETAGHRSGCCSAGVALAGNRIQSERRGELCFVWPPGQCPRRCGMRCGYCVVSKSAAFANDKRHGTTHRAWLWIDRRTLLRYEPAG
jgi:hypothetical protein